MAKSINKFIVRLADQTAFKPQLIVAITAIKEVKNKYLVKLLHPNTKEVVYSEEYISSKKEEILAAMDALNHGKTFLLKPEIQLIQASIEYKEQIFIPQGRRGKMKLKTRESVALENGTNFDQSENSEPLLEEQDDVLDINNLDEDDKSYLESLEDNSDLELDLSESDEEPEKIVKPRKEKKKEVIKNKKKGLKKEIKNKKKKDKPKKKIKNNVKKKKK